MEFKKGVTIESSDFWYDLTDGGYIKPEELLKNTIDMQRVNGAIATLMLFKMEAEKQGVLEEI